MILRYLIAPDKIRLGFGFYDFFGQESAVASAHKVLGEGVNKEQVQGTREGASFQMEHILLS